MSTTVRTKVRTTSANLYRNLLFFDVRTFHAKGEGSPPFAWSLKGVLMEKYKPHLGADWRSWDEADFAKAKARRLYEKLHIAPGCELALVKRKWRRKGKGARIIWKNTNRTRVRIGSRGTKGTSQWTRRADYMEKYKSHPVSNWLSWDETQFSDMPFAGKGMCLR